MLPHVSFLTKFFDLPQTTSLTDLELPKDHSLLSKRQLSQYLDSVSKLQLVQGHSHLNFHPPALHLSYLITKREKMLQD